MSFLIDAILPAGRAAVELALLVLLPIMVVMLVIMRLMEARGLLDWVVARLAPPLRPFGLTGLGVFAALQINFVSFAAPVATLAVMERRGTSDRHLAATFAMVLAMAQANAAFPMIAMGLDFGPLLVFSLLGGLVAAAATFHLFGRGLNSAEHLTDDMPHHGTAEGAKGVLDVINRAGAEAFKIATGAIPMLVLSLVAINLLRAAGVLDALVAALTPVLNVVSIDPILILPSVTKYLAGGTAMMGVMDTMIKAGEATATTLNAAAGFLIHPLDLPGVAVLMSAGPRVAAIWRPAALGAFTGILIRSAAHALFF